MQFDYVCDYCGEQFNRTTYYNYQLACPKCSDKNIKKLRDGNCDIFGYNDKQEPEDET